MTTTTSAYLTVTNNLAKMQAVTAADPTTKTASAFYSANIGKVVQSASTWSGSSCAALRTS